MLGVDPSHDLVAHLYAAALQLMRAHGQAFLPLEVVRERLEWSPEVLGEVVDHCVAHDPIAIGALRADWMDEGDRPAFGAAGMRFIGIRPAA
jgi:hypothetical protein